MVRKRVSWEIQWERISGEASLEKPSSECAGNTLGTLQTPEEQHFTLRSVCLFLHQQNSGTTNFLGSFQVCLCYDILWILRLWLIVRCDFVYVPAHSPSSAPAWPHVFSPCMLFAPLSLPLSLGFAGRSSVLFLFSLSLSHFISALFSLGFPKEIRVYSITLLSSLLSFSYTWFWKKKVKLKPAIRDKA